MKPIQQAFKLTQAALCLVNEWRDTISYTVGMAYLSAEFLQGHHWTIPAFFVAGTLREQGRSASWLCRPFELRLAGDNSPLIDKYKNSSAAGVTFSGFGIFSGVAAAIFFSAPTMFCGTLFIVAAGMTSCGILYRRGARLRDIPKIYFDKETGIWDWPRKNKGNGPTQTQKIKEGVSAFGKEISRRLSSRPALAPIRVRSVVPR